MSMVTASKDPKFFSPSPHLGIFLLYRFARKAKAIDEVLLSFYCRRQFLSARWSLVNGAVRMLQNLIRLVPAVFDYSRFG